jgi:hypothetical protein
MLTSTGNSRLLMHASTSNSFTHELSCDTTLEHYAGVRNVAVHDQGVFDPFLTDDGTVDVRQKTCALHPTLVRSSDIAPALAGYARIVAEMARSVVTQVLKAEQDDWGVRAIEATERLAAKALAPPAIVPGPAQEASQEAKNIAQSDPGPAS